MLQQIGLESVQELPPPTDSLFSQQVFRANHTALVENVKHLVMNVISGENYGECFARLGQNGFWEKMFGDYSQVSMDGSLEEFSMIWPLWGTLRDGVATELIELAPFIKESAFSLFPTPMASDGMAWVKNCKMDAQTSIYRCWKRGGTIRSIYYLLWEGLSPAQAADFNEMIMGFPKGHTDLNA